MAGIAWRKGFFRLWCVGSILWAVAVLILTSSNFTNPYVKAQSLSAMEPLNKDTNRYVESGPWNQHQKEDGKAQIIEFKFKDFPAWEIYVPINLSEKELSEIAEKASQQMLDTIRDEMYRKRIEYIGSTSLIVMTPVSFFLILGFMLDWVFRGFAGPRNG